MTELLSWLADVRKRLEYMLSHPLGVDFKTVSVQVQLHEGPNGFVSQLMNRREFVERTLAESEELQVAEGVVGESDKALLNSIAQVHEELGRTWRELNSKSEDWSKKLDKAHTELKLFEVN